MDLQFRTSYFYQLRYFNPNMLPFSTALSDPKWFHEDKSNGHIFIDSRGVVNGLRCKPIINKGLKVAQSPDSCPCSGLGHQTTTNNCAFLAHYRRALDEIDFENLYEEFENIAQHYWCGYSKVDHTKPLVIVLLVHEAVSNYCSERGALQRYFQAHGVECKEWEGTVVPVPTQPHIKEYLKFFMKKES